MNRDKHVKNDIRRLIEWFFEIQPKLRSFAYRYLLWSSIYCMSLTWIWNTSIFASLSFFDFIINYYLDYWIDYDLIVYLQDVLISRFRQKKTLLLLLYSSINILFDYWWICLFTCWLVKCMIYKYSSPILFYHYYLILLYMFIRL